MKKLVALCALGLSVAACRSGSGSVDEPDSGVDVGGQGEGGGSAGAPVSSGGNGGTGGPNEGGGGSGEGGSVFDSGLSSSPDAGAVEPDAGGPSNGGEGGESSGGAGGSGGGGTVTPPEPLPGDHLFSPDQILEFDFTLDPSDWESLEEHGDKEVFKSAAAEIAGEGFSDTSFAEVGLRHKGAYSLEHCWDSGARSYLNECAKLSFKVKFDEYDKEARFDGIGSLNLHASSNDATKLREFIAYETYREFGVDAPRTAAARVSVNGEFLGLFIAVEEVDDVYAEAHYPGAAGGNLFKEVWPNSGLTVEEFEAALETNDDEPNVHDMVVFARDATYADADDYEERLADHVEIPELLRYLAVDRALRNWDGITAFYSPFTPHNFYWYHDSGAEDRFHLIPWDLDNTLWEFDPYMHPEQWVTAPPVPDWSSEPANCDPRSVWEANGPTQITPPRCDNLLDILAEQRWGEFVEIAEDLSSEGFSLDHLQDRADHFRALIAPIVADDPTLDVDAWESDVEFFVDDILPDAVGDFSSFIEAGLIEEPEPEPIDVPSEEELNVITLDDGLHVGAITNFEFETAPITTEPTGTYGYAADLTTFLVSYNTISPISGTADLRLDFTFSRLPGAYDEWVNVGIGSAEADVTAYTGIVITLLADTPRNVRIRIESPAYAETFGGAWAEFGVDKWVDSVPTTVTMNFAELYYPSWAKDAWGDGQGFGELTDDEARLVTLGRFTGLTFGPAATVDQVGELVAETETGFLEVDNMYFQ